MTTTTTAPTIGTLAARAADALARARRHDPAFDTRPCDDRRAIIRRALTHDVAATFGVDHHAVTVTDDPDREHGGWRWFRVAITDDGNEYRFTSFGGTVDDLRILAPCPQCGGEVPRATGTELAALGRFLDDLTTGHPTPTPHEYEPDPGHAPGCPRHPLP